MTYAIVVDAGYLLAESARFATGYEYRNQIILDAPRALRVLEKAAREHSFGGEMSRLYWYDGRPAEGPTAEHLEIASQAGVTVRLGQCVHGKQRKVDDLIAADIRRISGRFDVDYLYIVTGDSDFIAAVTEARGRGARVIVVGVDEGFRKNHSAALILAADDRIVLSPEQIKYFARPAPGVVRRRRRYAS